MKRLKNLVYLLIFNILISAAVTYGVLYYWDLRPEENAQKSALVTVLVTVSNLLVTPSSVELQPVTPSSTTISSEQLSTPTPVRTQPYQVQNGDTLSKIALKFKVGMDDILRLNDLSDPNSLYAGQILLIPDSPLPTYTPDYSPTPTDTVTPTPQNTLTPTLTPTRDTSPAQLAIESILGFGGLESERVKITHTGGGDVSLDGWQLTDESGNVFIFPMLYLYPGGTVFVHTRAGISTVADLYWGLAQPIWESGEKSTLYDERNHIRATFIIP